MTFITLVIITANGDPNAAINGETPTVTEESIVTRHHVHYHMNEFKNRTVISHEHNFSIRDSRGTVTNFTNFVTPLL